MDRLRESKWFQIFAAGKWNEMEYTREDLEEVVRNFEKGFLRVPLIRGHNDIFAGEKPALGWVSALKVVGRKLMAKARNIDPELVDDVEQERYPERSIEIWHNYNGYGKTLGAVAFLGGSNPAVDSMAPMAFSKCVRGNGQKFLFATDGERAAYAFAGADRLEEDPDFVKEDDDEIEVSAGKSAHGTEHLSNTKNGKGGEEMTKEEMEKAIADAIAAATPGILEQFKKSEDYTSLVSANEKLTKDLEESQKNAAVIQVKAELEGCEAFAKQMLDERRITPAQHCGLGAFILGLDNSNKFEFEQGKEKVTPRAYFQALLKSLPEQNKKLFEAQDTDGERPTEAVGEAVAKFAAENGIDPNLLAKNFSSVSSLFKAGSLSEDDDAPGGYGAVSVAAKPKAA